jgi:hypothetical protein
MHDLDGRRLVERFLFILPPSLGFAFVAYLFLPFACCASDISPFYFSAPSCLFCHLPSRPFGIGGSTWKRMALIAGIETYP